MTLTYRYSLLSKNTPGSFLAIPVYSISYNFSLTTKFPISLDLLVSSVEIGSGACDSVLAVYNSFPGTCCMA